MFNDAFSVLQRPRTCAVPRAPRSSSSRTTHPPARQLPQHRHPQRSSELLYPGVNDHRQHTFQFSPRVQLRMFERRAGTTTWRSTPPCFLRPRSRPQLCTYATLRRSVPGPPHGTVVPPMTLTSRECTHRPLCSVLRCRTSSSRPYGPFRMDSAVCSILGISERQSLRDYSRRIVCSLSTCGATKTTGSSWTRLWKRCPFLVMAKTITLQTPQHRAQPTTRYPRALGVAPPQDHAQRCYVEFQSDLPIAVDFASLETPVGSMVDITSSSAHVMARMREIRRRSGPWREF